MARKGHIELRLGEAVGFGEVSDWYSYAPGDRGVRWHVWGKGWSRTFSTAEVEAFLVGLDAARVRETR